jgi:hypothetical protein
MFAFSTIFQWLRFTEFLAVAGSKNKILSDEFRLILVKKKRPKLKT